VASEVRRAIGICSLTQKLSGNMMATLQNYSREDSTRGRRDTSRAQVIPQPTVRTPVIAFLPPPSIYDAAVKMGVEKANLSW
jgi:hypothetical protein